MTATALRITAIKTQYLSCSQCQRYIREGHTVYMIDNRPVCEFCGCPDEAARINMRTLDSVSVAKRIRAALKARSGKDWSVTKGRGTASGWIRIDTTKARLGCSRSHDYDYRTNECQTTGCDAYRHINGLASPCSGHTCTDACYRAYITPEERAELGALLDIDNVHDQGVSIMASNDAYVEYIDRAEGRTPRRIGVAYWA